MKTLVYIITVSIFLFISVNAQVRKISDRQFYNQLDCEVSTSIATGISKATTDISPSYPGGSSYTQSADQSFYLEFSLLVGFFILDGLSIEPQIDLNLLTSNSYYDSENPSLSIIGNICYTLSILKKNIHPFIKIGYGISSIGASRYNTEGLFESLDSKVLNASIGLKIVIPASNAIRIELNYKRFSNSYSNSYYGNSPQFDVLTEAIAIIFGYSFLF
jgi:hypothetical protein